MNCKVDYLEAQFNFLEEEIDFRLELIKSEIDKVGEILKAKVKEMENDVLV